MSRRRCDVLLHLPTQAALDDVRRVDDPLIARSAARSARSPATSRVDPRLARMSLGHLRTDPVDVLQGVVHLLAVRNIDSCDSRHACKPPMASPFRARDVRLPLNLLVLRIGLANDPDLAVPPHDLTTRAHPLDACSHLHQTSPIARRHTIPVAMPSPRHHASPHGTASEDTSPGRAALPGVTALDGDIFAPRVHSPA